MPPAQSVCSDTMQTLARPLTIMHVVLALDVGGLERVVIDLVREGLRRGQSVSVLCIERPGQLAPEVEALGATVYCVYKKPGREWGVTRRILAVLDDVRPEILHTHHMAALMYAGSQARVTSGCVVHTQHNRHFFVSGSLRGRLSHLLLTALASRYARRFFCVSHDIAQTVFARHLMPKSKVVLVSNGIDVNRFTKVASSDVLRQTLSIPDDALVLGTIGRLSWVKRQDILIQAFGRVAADIPRSHLVIVGDGPMREKLQLQAKALGLSNRIHFTGYQPEPQIALRAMDIFVLTSSSEGMPLAVLEAGAMEVPVIASRVGGLEEVSDNGSTMLLYEFGDLDALVVGLRRLIHEQKLRTTLVRAARLRVVSEYSTKHMATEYESHYRLLLSHSSNLDQCRKRTRK